MVRSLATRPVVHVDIVTGKADGPHRKKLRIYLGLVTRDKVDVTNDNWEDIQVFQLNVECCCNMLY